MDESKEIRFDLISDLLHHLDKGGSLGIATCSVELQAFIEGLDLPMNLKRIFQWRWASTWANVGTYRIGSVEEVFYGEWFDRLYSDRMLKIGSAKNGDAVVVRVLDDRCEVGLINSAEFAGDEDLPPGHFYVGVCGGLDDLLFRLAEGKFLPVDYFSALQLSQLKKRGKEV